jgi:hypothetical protein
MIFEFSGARILARELRLGIEIAIRDGPNHQEIP